MPQDGRSPSGCLCVLGKGDRGKSVRERRRDAIPCEIRAGTRRDALLYSVGVNATHGLRRTNEDKRRSVLTLLQDDEWSGWSDREIARRCGVSDKTVAKIKGEVGITSDFRSERTYVTKHGTIATMNTAAIGRKEEPLSKSPQDGEPEEGGWPDDEPEDEEERETETKVGGATYYAQFDGRDREVPSGKTTGSGN